MITAEINQKFKLSIDELPDLEYKELGNDQFELYYQQQSYQLELLDFDPHMHTFSVVLDGYCFSIDLKDELRHIIECMRPEEETSADGSAVFAPIPGVIKKVYAVVGAVVQKGDPVLVLEAMKMENIIAAPESGILTELLVEEGQNVSKGDHLFTLLSEES